MKKKIAIVVGHTKLKPGACGVDIPCEFNYNYEVAKHLEDIADIYLYDNYNSGYKKMVKKNAQKMNKEDYDLILELHYNSSVPQANGCEVFYYFNNIEGKGYAAHLSQRLSNTFRVKNRGAKAMASKNQRGFWALFYPHATTLLLEPFFGSNPTDAAKFKGNTENYSCAIRQFLTDIHLI